MRSPAADLTASDPPGREGRYPPNLDALARSIAHLPHEVLAVTRFDLPIYLVRLGKHDGRPPILVTAAAHAEEVAGVATALALLLEAEWLAGSDWPVVVVPCRDPLGWEGVEAGVRRALGCDALGVRSFNELREVLAGRADVLHDAAGVYVARLEPFAVMALAPDHPGVDDTGEFTAAYLAERADLRDALREQPILVPGTPRFTERRSIFAWAGSPTLYVDASGRSGNFNRFFASDSPPIEVRALRDLVDAVRPIIVFDLHEGFGYEYCLYANGPEPGRTAIAREMVAAVRAVGHPIMSLQSLAAFTGRAPDALVEVCEGAYSGRRAGSWSPDPARADALGRYVSALGAHAFTTEMGMEASLDARYRATRSSAFAGVRRALALLAGDATP